MSSESETRPKCHGKIEAYRVTPDEDGGGDWHELTFEDGSQVMIFTDRPLVIVEAQKQ